MNKVTPFLMFNDQLEAAIEFYTSTFPDSEIRKVARSGQDGPIQSAEFVWLDENCSVASRVLRALGDEPQRG